MIAQIDPRFVQPEGLHAVGILLIDPAHFAAEADVERKVRRHADQIRAFLLRLPNRLSGFYAVLLGDGVLGQDDAVAGFDAAADGDRPLPDLGRIQAFDGCIVAVGVAVQNHPVQKCSPPYNGNKSSYNFIIHGNVRLSTGEFWQNVSGFMRFEEEKFAKIVDKCVGA